LSDQPARTFDCRNFRYGHGSAASIIPGLMARSHNWLY
jgi:hypothetical protein